MPVITPRQFPLHCIPWRLTGAFVLFFSPSISAQQGYYPPGIQLPAGAGRELVLAACTRCHDLKGVPAFKGYWTRQQWLAMIETMVKHGAPLDAAQAAQVADYLALHYGRQPAPAVPSVPAAVSP